MAKRTGPTNPVTIRLVSELRKTSNEQKVAIWKDLAERLTRPTRIRSEVNLDKIETNLKKDEIALIPGKLLGTGDLTKPITVAALRASQSAKDKLKAVKGQFLTIQELIKKNPKGAKVRILQ